MSIDMEKKQRRQFTPEFKEEAVRLVRQGLKASQVARDLDISPKSLSSWVQRAKIDAGEGPPGALTSAEREEMTRLRRELQTVRMERDFLKKAAAFFAKESK